MAGDIVRASGRRFGGAAVSLPLLIGLLSACGGGSPVPRAMPSASSPPPVVAREGSVEGEVSRPPTPAASAGPLSGRQLPEPAALGNGWSTHVEPGSAESGTVGNGSWVQQRQVGDVMDGLTPIGCPAEAVSIRPPRPVWALEGTYRGPGHAPGIGLVLEFPSQADAARFLQRLRQQIRACPLPRGGVDKDGPLVLTFVLLPSRSGTVSAVRKEYGYEADPNRYLLVAAQHGRRVGMVYLAGAKPDQRMRIADGLTASISR